jgi:hypothetical protein
MEEGEGKKGSRGAGEMEEKGSEENKEDRHRGPLSKPPTPLSAVIPPPQQASVSVPDPPHKARTLRTTTTTIMLSH